MPDEREDWFDEGDVNHQSTVEPRELLRKFEQLASGVPAVDDPLTQLWQNADASRGSGADAVEALRERHRQETAKRGRRRRLRGFGDEAS